MYAVNHDSGISSPARSAPRRRWRQLLEAGEPRRSRGPFARWPRASDAVLALAVLVTSVVAVGADALDEGEQMTISAIGERPLASFVLLAAAAAALWWRRVHPVAVAGFVLVVMIGWALFEYSQGQDVALIVAVYSVGRYANHHRHGLATVAAAVVVTIIASIINPQQDVDIAGAVILVALPWYVGRRVRNRGDYLALLQERARRIEGEERAQARQAVADERARIARELHDIVAHRVSMMTVQAGAAKTIASDDLDAAVEAMGDVEHAGRQALGELRHVLGVLRPDAADADDLGPQPGLADVPVLVDQLRNTGAEVTLSIPERVDSLPVALELSAYRIVQESLTNVVKHAGPEPTVEVSVVLDDGALVIDITNTTATTTSRLPASGFGIVGMRERATLLGGTLTAERQPPDLYRVRARLPLEPERA